MKERPSSKPPETPISEIPTIPAPPPNPFEQREKLLSVSASNIPDPTKQVGEDDFTVNEDADGNGALFSVEDGLGGHEGGEVASKAAAEAVRAFHEKFVKLNQRRREGRMPTPGTMQAEYELMKQMSKAVQRAVLDAKEKNPDLYDMATTGVMARTVRMKDGRWEVVGSRVGDSRIYVQYPDGRLESLTLDAHPLLDMIKGKYGREAAIRVQDTLDDLESFRQFENFSKFSREDKWPPKMPIDRQDIDFVSGLVNPELVKIYFEGVDRTPNATQEQRMEEFQKSMFHRSVVTGAYGLTPHADFFHGFLPAGGKLVLTSDGVEGLKRKEMAGLLMNNPDLIHPKIWQQAELADTPAERLAFAANAVASNYVWSPRNKGHDDITVVVAEIPER